MFAAAAAVPGAQGLTAWSVRGEGAALQAVWVAGGGDRASLRCGPSDPMLVLRVQTADPPPAVQRITLVVDGLRMDYPASPWPAQAPAGVESRIALDAPMLDRMLLARHFSIAVGLHWVHTGPPGPALAHVVRTCRALYWPRVARIASSDAGLAKK